MNSDRLPPKDARLARALLRAEIEELVVEYAYLLDRGRYDELVELFTDDCEMLRPLPPFTEPNHQMTRGRAALREWFRDPAAWPDHPRQMRHVCSNLRLRVLAEDRVEGTVAVIGYRHEGPEVSPAHAMMVGDYEDEYRRGADGRWRIHCRKIVIAFLNVERVEQETAAATQK